MRPLVKICGIKSALDAEGAVEAGCDFIGLNFYAKSKRFIAIDHASRIANQFDSSVKIVAVFVNSSERAVREVIESMHVDFIQFSGSETADFCESFSYPYFKAFGMQPGIDLVTEAKPFRQAAALLLDTYADHQLGGSGQTFDWSLWPSKTSHRLMLAGGLTPGNVREAVRVTSPWAVDVASGVEKPSGDGKDPELMGQFVAEAHGVQ